MITLSEARANIGNKVVYHKAHGALSTRAEVGVITSVNDEYVFVRYGSDGGSQATMPGDLTLVASHVIRGTTVLTRRGREALAERGLSPEDVGILEEAP